MGCVVCGGLLLGCCVWMLRVTLLSNDERRRLNTAFDCFGSRVAILTAPPATPHSATLRDHAAHAPQAALCLQADVKRKTVLRGGVVVGARSGRG